MDARVRKIISALEKFHPNPKPFLHFRTPFQLLIATILAAQCTDERVNKVTAALFRAAPVPKKILALGAQRLAAFVKPTGFYRAKTKNIIGAARTIIEKFGGRLPRTLEELQSLPGVGRKTASCVLAQAFKIPAFPVDRHVLRVANRLGLARTDDPTEADLQLRKKIPEKYWIHAHMQLVFLGRTFCRPLPKCKNCPLLYLCPEGRQRIKTGKYQQK